MESTDAEKIRDLVARSFDPSILPFMTFGQLGVASFLANRMRFPTVVNDSKIVVVDSKQAQGELSAFADFRLPEPEYGFLSNICVAPENRGQRMAGRLIEDFLESHPVLAGMELDMFSDNLIARRIYRSLGFETIKHTLWLHRGIGGQGDSADQITIPNLPSAIATWDQYGFCELEVQHNGREILLGLVGMHFRFRSVQDLEDESLMRAVSAVFPEMRSAFAVVPANDTPSSRGPVQVMREAERMSLDLKSHT